MTAATQPTIAAVVSDPRGRPEGGSEFCLGPRGTIEGISK